MTVVAACAHPADLLAWIECHPALAGYLQAVGVVAAILGSAWVAWFSILKPQEDEREHRAKVLRYRLMPAVIDIRDTAARVRILSRQIDYGASVAEAGETELAEWSLRIDANIPEDALSELHVLDNQLSEAIASLFYYLSRFNRLVRSNVPKIRVLPAEDVLRYRFKFDLLLTQIEDQSNAAQKMLMEALN